MSKRDQKYTKQTRVVGPASLDSRVSQQNGSLFSNNNNGTNPQNANGTGASAPQATDSYNLDRWLRQDAQDEPYHNVGSFGYYVPRPHSYYRPETSDNGTTFVDVLSGSAQGHAAQSRNSGKQQ